ncbi:MAG TPA: site-2 protease family protein [Acidobacteriota bacterium]|nr:site-2 protease family protein [Acidobacteriota bacterium]
MNFRGFRIFRIGEIEIIIDYSWFIVFFLVVYSMAELYFPRVQVEDYSTPQYWIMGTVAAVLLFISILIHELAHSFVAIRHGIKVASIRLFIFGGLAQVTSEPKSGRQEFLIALAGPASSIALGAFFLLVYLFAVLQGSGLVAGVAFWLGMANILLAFFNMIPGFPLDGGRILRAFLWDHWNDMGRATKVVSHVGNAFALFLIIFGILQFLLTQSLISGLWMVLIGIFMKQASTGSYQAVALKRALSGVEVRQLMSVNLVKVDWLLPLEQLVNEYIYKHGFTAFPVFNRDEFAGMVSLEGVKTVSRELWGFKQVRDIMDPVERVPSLKPTDDAGEALDRMMAGEISLMPVIENDHLLGIISRQDIINHFRIKSDLGTA